jgi:hypothetical protein
MRKLLISIFLGYLFLGGLVSAEVGPSDTKEVVVVPKKFFNATLLQSTQQQADESMRNAWQHGIEGEEQPVNTVVGSDGTIALAQNAPKRIITRPDGSLDISDSHTTITILQQPTPLPPVVPQDTRIQTTVDGIDHIETKAILPETLVVDQLEAVKKIADNGTLIAQQRFAVEQYKITSDAGLEYLRIVKSFILWGFLMSIPFIITAYWVFKNLLSGYHTLQKERLEHKLKELESAERQIAMTEKQFHPPRRES